MQDNTMIVVCGKCKCELEEEPNIAPIQRVPCPKCGSTSRNFEVKSSVTITAKSQVSVLGKRQGKGKPFIEQVAGDNLHRKTGKWMKRSRVIDRENDSYKETITDPATGEIIHHCDEPLSKHIGHGDDKLRTSAEQ
ncbi:MAG: hypothetical protein ABSA18_11400 [Dehalococcoidia bacterium]|jgi:hypothetical protein